jgi:hypothetical protein
MLILTPFIDNGTIGMRHGTTVPCLASRHWNLHRSETLSSLTFVDDT